MTLKVPHQSNASDIMVMTNRKRGLSSKISSITSSLRTSASAVKQSRKITGLLRTFGSRNDEVIEEISKNNPLSKVCSGQNQIQ